MAQSQLTVNIVNQLLTGSGVPLENSSQPGVQLAEYVSFFQSLYETARAKLYTYAQDQQFPVPFIPPANVSVLNYLAQTLIFTAGAKSTLQKMLQGPNPSHEIKDTFNWCQGMYMVAVYAAGGEFSFEESKKLELDFKNSNQLAPLLNGIFKNPRYWNFGNLQALNKLLRTWNLKSLSTETISVVYKGTDLFN